jgi:two-component system alkaline phosphatase synthesis response regulator PhoP
MKTIYCVEDDLSIRELVVYALKTAGFAAEGFATAASFFQALKHRLPNLILLDIMLPEEDGISILKKLKSDPLTAPLPVILLTAKSAEYDKVLGLDTGADDYITKPFSVLELLSRVKAVLRRTSEPEDNKVLAIDRVRLDREKHSVLVDGQEISLTLKEFELLYYLMFNKGIVLTRDKLLTAVWGYEYEGETRTVDVHIQTLRQKLGAGGNLIETVRGVGYRIGENR